MRTVALPAAILGDLGDHCDSFAGRGENGLVFVAAQGGHLRRRDFNRVWTAAVTAAGVNGRGLHFHDLRHTGNHLAAATGASTRQLMARMGHASMRACRLRLRLSEHLARIWHTVRSPRTSTRGQSRRRDL